MESQDKNETHGYLPEHLHHSPRLYVLEGEQIVEAPAEDRVLAQGYPRWQDKGAITQGKRLTILTKKTTYEVDEEIRVIHILEAPAPGYEVYVMGPKRVYGEYVDARLVTEPPPNIEEPWMPLLYNGVVLQSPAVDYNYEITCYSFSEPGTHQIYWQLGVLRSNTLFLEIIKAD